MARIILAMAVKNEAETIARAIRSVSTVCKEAVISIDTTDSQDTERVARETCEAAGLPVTILHHVWATPEKPNGSFSRMRNSVIDHIEQNVDGDWGLWVDGHEYLYPQHRHRLKFMARKALEEEKAWLYSLTMKMLDLEGVPRDSFVQAKMWRIGKGIRYGDRDVHNQFDTRTCPQEKHLAIPDVWMMHARTKENAEARALQRNDMMPKILNDEVEKDDDAFFHMLAHWYQTDNRAEFLQLLRDRHDVNNTKLVPDIIYQVELYTGVVYGRIAADLRNIERLSDPNINDKVKEMMRWSQKCGIREKEAWEKAFHHLGLCDRYSNERNDHHIFKGRFFIELGNYVYAIKHFELAATYRVPVTQGFTQVSDYTWQPFASIGHCFDRLDKPQQSWDMFNIALSKQGHVYGNVIDLEKRIAEKSEKDWPDNGKPRLLIVDKLQQFTNDLLIALKRHYNIYRVARPEPGMLGLADVIWNEWCDDNLIVLSRVKRYGKVLFTRLHGYETIEADYPAQVQWDNVDMLIGVSQQILDYANGRFWMPGKQCVIHNALNLERFHYRKRKPGRNIAFVSLLNNKKNIGILVECARALPDYTIHVAGRWQDRRLEEYFYAAKQREELDNLIYCEYIKDVDGFLEDKQFLLNTSLWESFSFAIHEAMAKGIKPLVHKWVSVDEFIPKDLQWGTMDELRMLLNGPYESMRYRELAEQYDVKDIAGEYVEMIEPLRARAIEEEAARKKEDEGEGEGEGEVEVAEDEAVAASN